MGFCLASSSCWAVGRHNTLWSRLFSTCRLFRRCGCAVVQNSASVLNRCRALHTCCPSCNASNALQGAHHLLPSGRHLHLVAFRAKLERSAFCLSVEQLEFMKIHADKSLRAPIRCSVWLTRHGARWWMRSADVEASASLTEEARACVMGNHDVPGWIPISYSSKRLTVDDVEVDEYPHCFFSLSGLEWRLLESWLSTAHGAKALQIPSPPLLRTSVTLEHEVRRSLLALSHDFISGDYVLLVSLKMVPAAASLDAVSSSLSSLTDSTSSARIPNTSSLCEIAISGLTAVELPSERCLSLIH